MELRGIITPVMEPTDWTHPLVVVAKKDGTPRICADLTKLNRHVDRPIHPLTTPKQAVSSISSKAKYFTTYDATHGYWQIPIAEESRALTTFVTPWGRFKFLRGPMGLVSTGDEYCQPILAHFDPTAKTSLMTDASRNNGMGYILTQHQDGQQRMIQCGSRFVTDTESRYSATELELGAVVWAMKKCRTYLLGAPKMFSLIVDHQALVSILDKHTSDTIENPRLQRMKEKLTPFLFNTIWKKGKSHTISDALSRAPVTRPTPEDLDEENMERLATEVVGLLLHWRAGADFARP